MSAKLTKIIPLQQRRHVEDFTGSELHVARLTIQRHLNNPRFQNTITQQEIQSYSIILDRKTSVICELVNEEAGDIVTMEQRHGMTRKPELVGA